MKIPKIIADMIAGRDRLNEQINTWCEENRTFFDCMRNAANMCVYRGEDVEYAMHQAFTGRLQEVENDIR